jgi:hypothetical protein
MRVRSWSAYTMSRVGVRDACLGVVVVAVAVMGIFFVLPWGAVAGEGSLSGGSVSLSGSPLLIEGAWTEAEQRRAAEEARLASPEAVRAREGSETAYSGLGFGESESLTGRIFPGLVREPDGGPPRLPEGARIVGFASDFAASLVLPEGRRGVLDSLAPIAVDTSSGRVPVDVSPRRSGSGFEAAMPAAGLRVRVGGRLSEGASLSDVGVSLAPVSEVGTPLEAHGVVDGAGVFYGDSEDSRVGVRDVDSLIKIGTYGFSEETILRSQLSPSRLFFRVGLPEGAELTQRGAGAPVLVVAAGRVIARIIAPEARDAEGTSVRVSLSLRSGDVVFLDVVHQPGQYRLPIAVDPIVEDTELLLKEVGHPGNWVFNSTSPALNYITGDGIGLKKEYGATYTRGELSYFEYRTQKESRIYRFLAHVRGEEVSPKVWGTIEPSISIRNSAGAVEKTAYIVLPNPTSEYEPYDKNFSVCAEASTCAAVPVAESKENSAIIEAYIAESGGKEFTYSLLSGTAVAINQEKGPSVSVDTTDSSLGGAPNGAYKWVNSSGRIGLVANDPGIGINKDSFGSPQAIGWGQAFTAVNGCESVQCNECWNWASKCESGHSTSGEPLTYSLSGLPDGKDTVEAKVEDAAGLTASVTGTVSIDNTPPYGIEVTGLPAGYEVGDKTYHFMVKASDGEGSVPSSGIKSIMTMLDGTELSSSFNPSSCSPGPCTASGELSINGEELAGGQHQLVVRATDGAGNVAEGKFAVEVGHAAPVPIGPGVVNPRSGEFGLSATDVALPGGLRVMRTYRSRYLSAGGEEGPFGRQWAFSLGNQEGVVRQSTGSVVLSGASSEQVIFPSNGQGGFESPKGDTNLTLSSVKEGETVKEYLLVNAATGAKTRFTQPTGSSGPWVPTVQEGTVPTDTVSYSYETVEVEEPVLKLKFKYTRPSMVLAPVPAGVSCAPELSRGCRALTFNWATETTAKGELPAEWGDYRGQLTRVYYTAWDPVGKAMKTVTVAQYSYDGKGRLRAEWDPRISPALKTIVAYDTENHVVSLTPPGQEPWLFDYGTTVGDSSPGRLCLRFVQARPHRWAKRCSLSTAKNRNSPRAVRSWAAN